MQRRAHRPPHQRPLTCVARTAEHHRYAVRDLWTNNSWSYVPRSITAYLQKPSTIVRTMPLAFDSPLDVTQRLVFHLPSPIELETGRFQSVIDDEDARGREQNVRRIILCSGKVYVDLISSEQRKTSTDVAIVRVEQLAPFPSVALRAALDAYPAVRDIVWLQEEPENMGAWEFMRHNLEDLIGDRYPLHYIGRARSASPSEGCRRRSMAQRGPSRARPLRARGR